VQGEPLNITLLGQGALPWVHARFVRKGTALPCPSSMRLSPVPAGEVRRGPPSAQPFFQPFPCPVKYVLFSQGRPCSVSEQTRSVEREQGKGVVTGFPGGAPPPSLPRGAGEESLQASPLAGRLLHDKSCMHPLPYACSVRLLSSVQLTQTLRKLC
jgi:hypothetical protein